MNRRNFIQVSGAATTGLLLPPWAADASEMEAAADAGGAGVAMGAGWTGRVILFDAFAIFDPRPVFERTIRLFPQQGAELIREWKIRQFEYTWLRNITGRYKDFILVIRDALLYAARVTGVSLTGEQTGQLIEAYYGLGVWPEVPAVLGRLKGAGYRLGFLSNFTTRMLQVGSERNGIAHHFEHLLSVDRIQKYKPDPVAYQSGMTAFGVKKSEVLFVPFAGWDAAGAKSFGYTTFWINRLGMPEEQLGMSADGEGANLDALSRFCEGSR